MGTNIRIVRGHDAKDYFKKEGEVLTNGLTYWYIHVRGKGLVRDAKQRVMRFTTKKMAKAYCANEKNLIFKNKKLDVIMVKTLKNEKHSLRVASVGSQKVYCVCDEYAEMERFLNEHPELKGRLDIVKNALKYDTYNWNYERLAEDKAREFLLRASEEFKRDINTSVTVL